jgi:antitoxin component of MazEF toxin-antitoxin module
MRRVDESQLKKPVVEPAREKTYNLEDLVKGINPDNGHDEVDFGSPEGKEVW